VEEALSHGYCDVTHLYSSCSGLIRVHSYRVPGVIEAGLNLDALTVQVIADGKHLPLSLLQLIYRCKGAEKIELITDGLEFAAGDLVKGAVYRQLNGVETVYEDGVMKLLSRESFAGSVATMHRCVRTMVQAGIPLRQAVRMASENPARRVGAAKKGRIAPGMDADLLLLDEKLDVKWVMAGGRVIRDFDAQKEA
jgi:N-acetylglucosamine-6-phosphate deacetylase